MFWGLSNETERTLFCKISAAPYYSTEHVVAACFEFRLRNSKDAATSCSTARDTKIDFYASLRTSVLQEINRQDYKSSYNIHADYTVKYLGEIKF